MATMRCHYEVFEIDRNATLVEIKKQYKKLALRFHPDRNHGREEEAAEKFKEVTNAYAVLSDAQERKWYDDHREAILRGNRDGTASSSGSGKYSDDFTPNLWPFFSRTCFKNFDDRHDGFYAVYGGIFDRMREAELDASPENDLPSFGTSLSEAKDVGNFYANWTSFVSRLSFTWEDKYNPLDAPNRDVRRQIDKENKKSRDDARREYVDEVRALAFYVRKRDPRMQAIEEEARQRKAAKEAERAAQKKEEADRRKEARERRIAQMYDQDAEQRHEERQRAFLLADVEDDDEDDEEDFGEADEDAEYELDPDVVGEVDGTLSEEGEDSDGEQDAGLDTLRCELCRKDFKSLPQLEQHLDSKAHKKKEKEETKKQKGSNRKKVTSSNAKADSLPDDMNEDEIMESLEAIPQSVLNKVERAIEVDTAHTASKKNKKKNKKKASQYNSDSESSEDSDEMDRLTEELARLRTSKTAKKNTMKQKWTNAKAGGAFAAMGDDDDDDDDDDSNGDGGDGGKDSGVSCEQSEIPVTDEAGVTLEATKTIKKTKKKKVGLI